MMVNDDMVKPICYHRTGVVTRLLLLLWLGWWCWLVL